MSKIINNIDRPIFVVGTPRSGTTLTANIIGNHSNIFMPGETHFFDDIYSKSHVFGDLCELRTKKIVLKKLSTIYKRFNQPDDQERIERLFNKTSIINQMRECDTYETLFSNFMKIQAEDCCKTRWGNQTPRDVFNINQIHTFYPEAKIVICVRDVRDFLISYKNRWKVTTRKNATGLKEMYHPALTSFLWKSTVRQIDSIQRVVGAKNLFVLRYEYLVQNPEQAVTQLFEFIGEKFETSLLNVNFQNSSFESGSSGIFTGSVGRWKKDLSTEEIAVSQWICRKEMTLLHYKLESVKFSPMKIVWIIFTVFISFASVVKESKTMRGPLLPYLIKRFLPLYSRKT